MAAARKDRSCEAQCNLDGGVWTELRYPMETEGFAPRPSQPMSPSWSYVRSIPDKLILKCADHRRNIER
jgi:hypothetical protein